MLTAILFAAGIVSPLYSAPRISPSVFTDVKAEVNYKDLIEYSLMASGLSGEQLGEYRLKFEDFLASLPLTTIADAPVPAEALLLELHRSLFSGYIENQTYIQTVFDKGVYNCVSSAVIYAIACVYSGIEVSGVLTADHAFCRVTADSGLYDVETTTPFGFNPGEKREFTDAFGHTGFTYVPPGNYRQRTDIGLLRLISIILKNRVGSVEREGDFETAVELSVERFALSANDTSYREMVQEFLNYVSYLNVRAQYSEAIAFLDAVREKYGLDEAYAETLSTLLYNNVVTLCQNGATDQARTFVDMQYEKGNVTDKNKQELLYVIGDSLGMKAINDTADPVEASASIDTLYADGLLEHGRYVDFKVVLISREADSLAKAGQAYKALLLIRKSREVFGPHKFFTDAQRVYEHNAAVELHNQAADLINANDIEGAAKIIDRGLEMLPGNAVLLKDKRTLESMRR